MDKLRTSGEEIFTLRMFASTISLLSHTLSVCVKGLAFQ